MDLISRSAVLVISTRYRFAMLQCLQEGARRSNSSGFDISLSFRQELAQIERFQLPLKHRYVNQNHVRTAVDRHNDRAARLVELLKHFPCLFLQFGQRFDVIDNTQRHSESPVSISYSI